MLLENKVAVIYGGGGAIGGAAARALAAAGAQVHLAGRTRAKLETVAADIGDAEVAVLDAFDKRAVEDHAGAVAAEAGGIDIALNAVSFPFVHVTPAADEIADIMRPIEFFVRTNLITAKAVAKHRRSVGRGRSSRSPRARPSWCSPEASVTARRARRSRASAIGWRSSSARAACASSA
jgi:3-oxoacyl-[acyl-carrier protein] reductase